jgi:propanediol utilization protein
MREDDVARLTEEIARRVKARFTTAQVSSGLLVPVSVSARHVHLTRDILESLFGTGASLTPLRQLSQPGEFAADQTVTLVGPSRRPIEKVRLLGPLRAYTQVELARSDGLRLGIELPVRASGDLAGTPGLTLIGPYGTAVLGEGAIRPTRHIHMTPDDARRFRVTDGQVVGARIGGVRALVFEQVLIRVSSTFVLDFHLDTDDANAAGVDSGSFAEIVHVR